MKWPILVDLWLDLAGKWLGLVAYRMQMMGILLEVEEIAPVVAQGFTMNTNTKRKAIF